MAFSFKAELLRHAATAMIISATLSLVACAPQAGADDATKEFLALRGTLVSISGVEDAQVGGGFDGSPDRRKLNVTLYVNDMSAEAVTPIVEEALAEAWAFEAFVAVSYSIQVWPTPIPTPPRDANTMFDIKTIKDALGIEGGYVQNRQLFLGPTDLEAKFGSKG